VLGGSISSYFQTSQGVTLVWRSVVKYSTLGVCKEAINATTPQNSDFAIGSRKYKEDEGDHLVEPIRHPNLLSPDTCLYWNRGKITSQSSSRIPNRSELCAVISPYVDGESLTMRCARLSDEEKCSVAYQLAGAIAHLSANRIVHGDLHPDNVIIGEHTDVRVV
jgi:hypothetical protein